MTILSHYFMRPVGQKPGKKANIDQEQQFSGCRQQHEMVNRALLVAAKLSVGKVEL
jgi:hypothetical protein